ncbi:MAG: hypothetical protein J6S19_06655 [Lentisphaeria bacterium]|nr:hypothetical protein [Lentisphaeria bacterium]
MKISTVLLLCVCCVLSLAAAPAFDSDDIGKVLYVPGLHTADQSGFLVLDEIKDSGYLVCHRLGSTGRLQISNRRVRKLVFFENSTPFMITQYALYNVFTGTRENLSLQLARLTGDANNRLQMLDELNTQLRQFKSKLNKIQKGEDEEEDKLEEAKSLLEDLPVADIVKRAAADKDWLLTTTLYETSRRFFTTEVLKIFPGLNTPLQEMMDECLAELLELFSAQQKVSNVRRELFLKHYSKSRGGWTNPHCTNYDKLKKLFVQSMQGYFKLDKLSRIFEPQDWGSAMLDALLMVEGTPGAAELEKEFDDAMRNRKTVIDN